MDNVLEYDYKAKTSRLMSMVIVFGSFSAALVYEAVTNDMGLTLDYIIQLTTAQATLFYGVLAALCLLLFFLAICQTLENAFSHHKVRLTNKTLSAPDGLVVKKLYEIQLSEIKQCTLIIFGKTAILQIETTNRKLALGKSYFPNAEAFKNICLALNRAQKLPTEQLKGLQP